MPDSMTNIKMDDVLSSIRRLVSEDGGKYPDETPDKMDRFVLTPALRVPDRAEAQDKEPREPVAKTTPPAPLDLSVNVPADLTRVLSAAAEAGQTARVQKAETLSPPPEFEAMEKAWKQELARVASARQEGGDDGYDGDGSVSDTTDTTDTTDAGATQSLEHQIAELEEAVGQASDDWEPDGSEPESEQPPRRHIFEVVAGTGSSQPSAADADAGDNLPMFSHKSVPRPKPYLLSDVVSAPDSLETAPGPATPMDIQDPPLAAADIVEDDDIFLDAVALKAMIAEVVREELQGKLGETITRNVRRMVQQEVAQAITSQPPDDDS